MLSWCGLFHFLTEIGTDVSRRMKWAMTFHILTYSSFMTIFPSDLTLYNRCSRNSVAKSRCSHRHGVSHDRPCVEHLAAYVSSHRQIFSWKTLRSQATRFSVNEVLLQCPLFPWNLLLNLYTETYPANLILVPILHEALALCEAQMFSCFLHTSVPSLYDSHAKNGWAHSMKYRSD
jgi:hypothetical protein